jgi:DNA end-binding protein Ku
MYRSMWMGMLNFGLVSMPVKLYSAVSSKTVHFNHLHADDHARVYTKRFCMADEEEVAYDELVRGYEIAPERYVVVEDDELAAIAPEFTRTIEIEDFVDLEEIDRVYLDQSYHMVPSRRREVLSTIAQRDAGRRQGGDRARCPALPRAAGRDSPA